MFPPKYGVHIFLLSFIVISVLQLCQGQISADSHYKTWNFVASLSDYGSVSVILRHSWLQGREAIMDGLRYLSVYSTSTRTVGEDR